MPIYEFYCAACHLVSSFLSARVDTTTTPACPRCGGAGMTRRASPFAVSRGRKDEPTPSGTTEPGVDDERLARAMESLAAELEGAGEGDPRRAAALMRKAYEAAGLPVTGRLEEAFRRMERALRETRVEGIETSVPFFLELLADPHVRSADVSTQFLEKWTYQGRTQADADLEELALVAASLAAASEARSARGASRPSCPSPWRTARPTFGSRD